MFEISTKNCSVSSFRGILGSDGNTSGLTAHFSHSSGAVNTVLFTIETFNEHSRMAKLSQSYLRGHMR